MITQSRPLRVFLLVFLSTRKCESKRLPQPVAYRLADNSCSALFHLRANHVRLQSIADKEKREATSAIRPSITITMISLPRYLNCLPTLCELKSNNGIFLLHCCRWCSHDDDVWFVMYTRSEPQQQSTAIQRAWDSGKEIKNWFLSSSWDVFNLSKIVLYFIRSISFEIFWPFW